MQNHTETLVRHAALAYRREADVRLVLGESGGRLLKILDDPETGAHGHVAVISGGQVVVAFRGSDLSVNDWRTNFARQLTDCPEGRIHRGFLTAYESIARQLLACVGAAARPVIITGHSLGGALATIAASRLHGAGHLVEEVQTFGSPRVGDAAFADHYDGGLLDITWRHVNCCDLVPRVPTNRIHQYCHVGQEIYWDIDGRSHLDASLWFKMLDRIQARIAHWGRVPTRGISDHLMTQYRFTIGGQVL